MKRILHFKHWQLFLLIVIPAAWVSPSPLQEIINSISWITFLIWIYAIGRYGHEKIEQMGLPGLNLKLFTANTILVPALLMAVIFIAEPATGNEPELGLSAAITIPLVLYLIFAVFHIVIFAAKVLATIEHKGKAALADYLANVVLMSCLFLGIWILQPKISRLIGNEDPQVTG